MNNETKANHRLWLQVGGFFRCPYEWCIVDFVYWRSNTQPDRRWVCRMKPIQETTPVKRIETITDALERMCKREMGFYKIPFGPPQRRRCGKGREQLEAKQSYQYIFDANIFDQWLERQQPDAIRKQIDPYPKTDSTLSESGQLTYPKTDSKRMSNKEENKEPKEGDLKSKPVLKPEQGVDSSFLTSIEIDKLQLDFGLSKDHIQRLENNFIMTEVYGIQRSKPRNGFDSLL